MDAYKTINDILVNLINEIWELEEKAIITEEFKDLTNNDMHVIEAIGPEEGNNMSSIAKKLNITVGSLTTAMNSLVNKSYVSRSRSEKRPASCLCKAYRKRYPCLSAPRRLSSPDDRSDPGEAKRR